MAFTPLPDTVRVRIHITVGSQGVGGSITLHFQRPEFDYEDMEELADALAAGFVYNLMGPLDPNATADLIEIYDMRQADGWVHRKVIDIDGRTDANNTPLPPSVACCVTFDNPHRGPWHRGRNYVPGLSEQNVDELDIEPDTVSAILLAYTALLDVPPAAFLWVTVSRWFEGAKRPEPLIAAVEGVRVRNNLVAFQTRRNPRP